MESNMVKHIVMWNVRGENPEQKKESAMLVKTAFESLSGRIPGLTKLEVGVDVSAVDYACDVVLYTEFESQESLAAYASHPEHLRVKQIVGDVRIARYQVDYI
jgi:Stress responsive A/B Barrel Domain